MKRLMIPVLVCLLLTPYAPGADSEPAAKPAVEQPVVEIKAKPLELREEELAKKAAQLVLERAALTKEKDSVEFDRVAAATAKAAADTERAKLGTLQAAAEAEKASIQVLRVEIDAEKVNLDSKLAAVAEEQGRLAAFAAELDGTKIPSGEPAEAIIAGPEEADAGTLVVLDASGSKAAAFMWLADGLTEDQYDIDSSGKRLYFATPCQIGTYKFVLSVALDNTVDAIIHTVQVGEAPEPPPDPPGPDPPPLTGFSKEVYDWVIELVPAEAQVEPAAAFHDNYMAIASQIVAGALNDLEKVDWEITKLNRGSVDAETRELWLPWFEKLKERFEALEASGDLTTAEDASALFLDIAKGLKEIK